MKTKLLILGALLTLQCVTIQAQIPITTNTVAPAIGAYDQYYLPGPVDEATGAMNLGSSNTNSGENDVLTYVAGDKTSQGQSFTTGSNPSGYTINSVTVRHILWTNFLSNGTFMSITPGSSFDFRFGTISGANITPILTTNATYSGSDLEMAGGGGTGIYFTFDLSGAGIGTLAPNTTYFFELASEGNPPYFELHNTETNATSYTGGTAFSGDTTASLDQSGVVNLPPNGGEFAFDAALTAVGAPAVVAVANPANGSGGQFFTVTATVTLGVGTVTNVSVDLSAIGGSAAAGLVLSNANVYTNTFTVPVAASPGSAYLNVNATDTTPLVGTYGVLFTVLPSDRIWNGGSLIDSRWDTTNNWQGGLPPVTSGGNNVFFSGTTRLTPDMNASYSLTELVFSNTAGSFTIGSSTGGTLTVGSGGIINNSANVQAFNVPVVLGVAQTFNAAAGNLTLNSNVTGSVDLTTTGAGTVTFASAGTNSINDLRVNSGQLNITTGTVNVTDYQGSLTRVENNATVVVSGGTLNIVDGGNGWFPIGVTTGSTGVVTVAGGTINVLDHWGTEVGNESGAGILNINSGTFLNNDIGGVGFLVGETGSMGGTVNLNGGALIVNSISAHQGGSFYFNGGTLEPIASNAGFWNDYTGNNLIASIRNGGAVVDNAGFSVTIGQPLLHSTVAGDNAIDGGLISTGSGILTLSGANTYTGNTTVSAGTLEIVQAVLATNSTVTVASGAVLQLDFAETNQLASLVLNGVSQAPGVYNSTTSPTYITSTGSLLVSSAIASNPTNITFSVSGGTLSLSWPADHLGWILQSQTNSLSVGLSTNWVDVTGSAAITSTNIAISAGVPTAFYRLRHP
jgi:autotransporter-associated beta strand protein